MRRLLLVMFFFEAGFVLIVAPWSAFWDRNYFAQVVPALGALITNNFVRGGVSGLGVINLLVGLAELVSIMAARTAGGPAPITPSRLAGE